MKQLLKDLNYHLSMGRHLFPLRKEKPNRKMPLHKGFNDRNYTKEEIKHYIEANHGIGWYLGPTDIVLDIDPRLGGEVNANLERLEKDWVQLGETPTVLSGGLDNGQHYYIALPEKVKIKSKIPQYPKLDFRSYGYVVLPGSLHPISDRRYRWDPLCDPYRPPEQIPQWLLKLLIVPQKSKLSSSHQLTDVSEKEVKFYLDQLDPTEFRSRMEWLEIGFMVHHALGPTGEQLFLDWSAKDDAYKDRAEDNERIWNSIRNDTGNPLAFGSLVQAVLDRGGSFYQDPLEDFKTELTTIDDFRDEMGKAPPNIDTISLSRLIDKARKYGPDQWEVLRKEIKDNFDVRLATIDKVYKQLSKKNKKIDPALIITDRLLDTRYAKGKHIVHAINQQFYGFRRTHWEGIKGNIITKQIFETSEDIVEALKIKASPLKFMSSVQTALVAKTAEEKDVFGFVEMPPSVMNCRNGEIWIDEKTGEIELKPHSASSHLLYCLDVEYNPGAKCPVFKKALKGIFEKHEDPKGSIRHLFEIFGYIIQPRKDIASWFMLYGRGNNGKSMTIEILQSLLGPDAILPRSIHDLTGQSNNHAIASLVGKLLIIDDDARTDIPLPASALKKLAEHKLWEANPKGKDAFVFRSSATPIALINEYPPVKDLSYGMMRRTHIIPFNRIFLPSEDDKTIKQKVVESELSGVLNEALAGLKRLRARGYFEDPPECRKSKQIWLRNANPVVDWIETCCQNGGGRTALTTLFENYRYWSKFDAGVKVSLTLAKFINSLEHLDYAKDGEDIEGLTLIGENDDQL